VSGPSPDPHSRQRPPLLPKDWPELAPLLDAALDAAPEHRAALIIELSAGDHARQLALEHLLAECERDGPLLSRVAADRFDALATETADSLLPTLIGDRYRVERELGHGGMARVYLAHDLKHGRDVAIKVIRPGLAASLGHDRFLREIEIAARLNHPNIVPLYDSGDVAGALYFVMPRHEGPSLRQRLSNEGPLPVAEALHVLRDIARALAYAHARGVVHRDVKPDNVMLSGGAAVVADFGIAKAVSAAMTNTSGATVTESGSVIGTPAYMAPEQAVGDPTIDHRADIYSFGCVAYELLTGDPPFKAESVHRVIAAHIGTVPRPVTSLRSDVPATVSDLIARCLEKQPIARPQSAQEVLDALDGATTSGSSGPAVTELVRRRARTLRWAGLALAAGLLGTAAWLATRASNRSAPITLTVLPFGNIGADSAMDFVVEGLADDVAGALTRVPGIQIRSRSGARTYRRKVGVDVSEAGARLRADYVMTAVVRQDSGSWIVSADLARAADATSLWTERFILRPDQQAGAAETIAAKLTVALRSRFPQAIGSAPALATNQRTSNSEAYRLYLRGQNMLDRRGQSIAESPVLFRAAIREDSLYARAWSGLSMALALFPIYQGVPARDVHDEIIHAARRALELDSSLAQPHVALGMALGFENKWDSAAAELKTAVGLDGHLVEARNQYARHFRNRGRLSDALIQLRAARVEDPSSAVVLSQLSYVFFLNHQLDSALRESQRALDNDPTSRTSLGLGAMIRVAVDSMAAARTLIDRAPNTSPVIGWVLVKTGDTSAARRRLDALDAQRPQPWNAETVRAYTYLGLGDTTRALAALERATDAGETWPAVESYLDPMYDPIRGSKRFQQLLRRVGLSP
jgi:serine/threonine-protein kinase